MQINIKEAILEGYSYGEVLEGTIRDRALNQFNKNSNYVLDAAGNIVGMIPGIGMIPGTLMTSTSGYQVGAAGNSGNSSKVAGVLSGKEGAMGALSMDDKDITLGDVYTKKNIGYSVLPFATGGALLGAAGGPGGAVLGAAGGAGFGLLKPGIRYGMGKVYGSIGNYASK